MEAISATLTENERWLAAQLGWPENMGIRMRRLTIGSGTPVPALLVWVDFLTKPQDLHAGIVGALTDLQGAPHLEAVTGKLRPDHTLTVDPRILLRGILRGATALLAEGWQQAILIDAGRQDYPGPFAENLEVNLGLIRARLQRADLRAHAVDLGEQAPGPAILVYLQGAAPRSLVRHVRRWLRCRAPSKAILNGELAGNGAVYGLIPRFGSAAYPDKAAFLLEQGYVAVLTDRVPYVYTAPVTAAAMLTGPGDLLRYPVSTWLRRIRVVLYLSVLLIPGAVVALMNYHHEMMPTSFLLAVASVRENSPFGVVFEVLLLAVMAEVIREASLRRPLKLSAGSAFLAMVLVTLVAVQVGFVGPVPGLAALAVSMISLALPDVTGAYMVRFWRFVFIFAAVTLGFFAMAAVFTLLLGYLCQARSWGVPVLGPSGMGFDSQETRSAEPPLRKGGRRRGQNPVHVR